MAGGLSGRLRLRQAMARLHREAAMPTAPIRCLAGDGTGLVWAAGGPPGSDLIWVRPVNAQGQIMLARNLSGHQWAEGDPILCEWMRTGLGANLLKVIHREKVGRPIYVAVDQTDSSSVPAKIYRHVAGVSTDITATWPAIVPLGIGITGLLWHNNMLWVASDASGGVGGFGRVHRYDRGVWSFLGYPGLFPTNGPDSTLTAAIRLFVYQDEVYCVIRDYGQTFPYVNPFLYKFVEATGTWTLMLSATDDPVNLRNNAWVAEPVVNTLGKPGGQIPSTPRLVFGNALNNDFHAVDIPWTLARYDIPFGESWGCLRQIMYLGGLWIAGNGAFSLGPLQGGMLYMQNYYGTLGATIFSTVPVTDGRSDLCNIFGLTVNPVDERLYWVTNAYAQTQAEEDAGQPYHVIFASTDGDTTIIHLDKSQVAIGGVNYPLQSRSVLAGLTHDLAGAVYFSLTRRPIYGGPSGNTLLSPGANELYVYRGGVITLASQPNEYTGPELDASMKYQIPAIIAEIEGLSRP